MKSTKNYIDCFFGAKKLFLKNFRLIIRNHSFGNPKYFLYQKKGPTVGNPKLYRCPVTRRQTSMSYIKNKPELFFENYNHLKNRRYLHVIIQDYIINK